MMETWLEDAPVRGNGIFFHQSIWNHRDNLSARTNNDEEGWHSKFNRRVKKV